MKCCCSNCGWFEVNPSGAMFCGYSDERTRENESCMAWKDKDEPQTNGNRIRAMTDEELAEWASAITHNEFGNKKDWLEWLKKEVVEE